MRDLRGRAGGTLNLSRVLDLAERWEEEADLLRRRGAPRQAEALESAAEELTDRLREWELELLTLEEAARETGLAYDTVQKKVASGEWPNRDEKGHPRVRRCDVLPGLNTPALQEVEDPVEDLARETLQGRSR